MRIGFMMERIHSDLILKVDGQGFNCGYHYHFGLPIMIWLSNLQLDQGNLFRGFHLAKERRACFEYEDWKLVEEVVAFARKLPIDFEEFNLETGFLGVNRFSNGTHNFHYNVSLLETGLRYLRHEKDEPHLNSQEVFFIPQSDFGEVVQRYLAFSRDEQCGRYRHAVPFLFKKLKKFTPEVA